MNARSGSSHGPRRGRAAFVTTLLGALAAAACLALWSTPAVAQSAAVPSTAARAANPAATPAPSAAAGPPAPAHALVVTDRTPLRAAPRDGGAVQAELTQGDLLELRGRRLDHLQVYDHRRERSGYVRADAVRSVDLHAGSDAVADELQAVWRFLRNTPGQEALGIAYVAAWLQAARPERIGAEGFDALGRMAERLARRAASARAADATAAHLEAVGAYGVRFVSFEREGRVQLCYEGEAFRRVLALPADALQRARAMLALTRHDCVDPALTPHARVALDSWRADLLDRPFDPPAAAGELPILWKNRLHLRRAGLWAARAHQLARQQRPPLAAAERALAELAAVDKAELAEEDQAEYAEAAIRVGAVRWAAVPSSAAAPLPARLRLVTLPGAEPGQTCVQLYAVAPARGRGPEPALQRLAERCTFGVVWTASANARPAGDALVLAVQPLEGWSELWLFRAEGPAWRVEVLPPAPGGPGLGYAEFAGWVPGAAPRMLVAREAGSEGKLTRRFEVLALDTLAPVKQASSPHLLAAFGQWGDVQWRRRTVALR